MRRTFLTVAGTALVLALAVGAGYVWGRMSTATKWEQQMRQSAEQLAQLLENEQKRGVRAAAAFLTEKRNLEKDYAALTDKFRKLPKSPLIVNPCTAALPAAQPLAMGDESITPTDPELTFATVRLWNSALTGIDTAAGACGLVNATADAAAVASACASGAQISLGDALTNLAINAQSCAEDRLRHQHLIDFLSTQTP